jgi:hypothetical protein
MAITYRIKIVRSDLQLEVDGDKKFVLEMLARFDKPSSSLSENTPSAGKAEPVATVFPATVSKDISPGEFIRKFGFKKHTDLVLAFGYYLEKHSGLSSFSAADINNCYYEAKLENSNTSQMIIQNIKRGYLMQARVKGEEEQRAKGRQLFTLTSSGEEHLRKAASVENQE